MSRIEETIRSEKQAAAEKAAAKEAAEEKKRAAARAKWVKEETPRCAKFWAKVNKAFPCLEGDFKVDPRPTVGYLDAPFTAIVKVEAAELKIEQWGDEKKWVLFIPYDTTRGYRWERHYRNYELLSNDDLKDYIQKYIEQCEYERKKAEDYYDSLPIGNTD